jgi:hypothetical protein
MIDADDLVHRPSELRGAEGPSFFQQEVVNVFQADGSELSEDIQRIQKFLEIDKADFPRPFLALDDCFECVGSGAMAAASVEEDKVDLFTDDAIFARAAWTL